MTMMRTIMKEPLVPPGLPGFRDGHARPLRTQWERICVCVCACTYVCMCGHLAAIVPLILPLFVYLFIYAFIYLSFHSVALCGRADLISSSEPPRDTCPPHRRKAAALRGHFAVRWRGFVFVCGGQWTLAKARNLKCNNTWYSCVYTHTITIVVISSRQRSSLLLILSPSTWDCSHSLRITPFMTSLSLPNTCCLLV